MKLMQMDESFLNRGVNEGFSGGEKKRNEILQMAVLEPKLALLDETDSGLDIDALRVVASGVNSLRSPGRAIVMVTHYQRLLDYIAPDVVHVLSGGRILKSGDRTLALELERRGYDWVRAGGGRRMNAVALCRRARPVPVGVRVGSGRGCRTRPRCAAQRSITSWRPGFPSPRDEAWKYTSLRRLESRRFTGPYAARPAPGPSVSALSDTGSRVTVLDGRVLEVPGPGRAELQGFRVRTLAEALADGEQQSTLLRVPAGGGTERFAALNASLCPDAIVVDVARRRAARRRAASVRCRRRRFDHESPSPAGPRRARRRPRSSSCTTRATTMPSDSSTRTSRSRRRPTRSLRIYRQQSQGARTFLIERIEATVGQRAG